ncbi:MAG TPA: serine/threonine-protein kinase [Ktedonobacteraceae bacterium]
MNANRLYSGHGRYTGKYIGNYRVLDLLGKGGFAEVYLCQHRYIGMLAAVKVLRAGMDEVGEANFYAEARIAASLVHPRIIRVLEFGVDGYSPFLVMDYAPNGTLRRLYPRGTPMTPYSVVRYIEQVAQAVQYVHNRGLVHRDIKPENLLLGAGNQLLLSDFGISVNALTASHTKGVAGTAAYMAPELIDGEPCYASDQYALGVVAYEWLCGTWPFLGSGDDILEQHLYDFPPPLREHVPTISGEVEEVVLRALAKNPRDRFDSVLEFATTLKTAARYRAGTGKAQTRLPMSQLVSGNATASTTSQPHPQPPDIWSKILSLFTFDFFAGIAVGTVLYGLKVAPSLLWVLLSLSLVLFALVGALVMRSRALFLLVCGLTILAALPAVAFQSPVIFVVCYLILSGLSLSAALATSIRIPG